MKKFVDNKINVSKKYHCEILEIYSYVSIPDAFIFCNEGSFMHRNRLLVYQDLNTAHESYS